MIRFSVNCTQVREERMSVAGDFQLMSVNQQNTYVKHHETQLEAATPLQHTHNLCKCR